MRTLIKYAPVITYAFISATLSIIGKKLGTMPTGLMLFLRLTFGLICFLPFVPYHEFKKIKLKHIFYFLGLGFFGPFLSNMFFYSGVAKSTALNAALINALNPGSIFIMTTIMLKKRPKIGNIISILIAFIGVICVLTQGKLSLDVVSTSSGELLLFGSVVLWGVYSIIIKKLVSTFSARFIIFIGLIIGFVLLAIYNIWHSLFKLIPLITFKQWLLLAYLGVPGIVIAYILYGRSIKRFGPSKTIFIIYSLAPLFVTLLSLVFLHDPISRWDMLGLLFISIALYVNNKSAQSS